MPPGVGVCVGSSKGSSSAPTPPVSFLTAAISVPRVTPIRSMVDAVTYREVCLRQQTNRWRRSSTLSHIPFTTIHTHKTSTHPDHFSVCAEQISNGHAAMMKAIRVNQFGGPEVLKFITDAARPRPGPTDILVNVKAVGVNPVETYIRSGSYKRTPELPFTPGFDCSGVVEEVGQSVSVFKVGDRVWTWKSVTGTYAEYSVIGESGAFPLPKDLSFEAGAALGIPYLTAYRALFHKGGGKAGETVLVHGASGGVGVATVQWAKGKGMKVVGTAGTPEGLEIVKKAGADVVFNHKDDNYTDKITEWTGGSGFDLVIEMAAHINLGKDLAMLNKFGRIVIVGSGGEVQINPRLIMGNEALVTAVMLFNISDSELEESVEEIQKGSDAGWLRPIIGKKFEMSKANDAHKDIMEGAGALGRTILTL